MNVHISSKSVDILLVEDNLGDVRLTKEAFKECHIKYTLHVVHNGVEALRFLRKEGGYQDSPRPSLILLDLNLPKMNGREVLETIKTDSLLRRIPVVILTTSLAEDDIIHSYNMHANCYIPKPVSLDKFEDTVRAIEEFWLNVGELPE